MLAPLQSVLSEAQRQSLEISDFIFHIIEPEAGADAQVLFLDEVQLQAKQKEFFLSRLQEVLDGTQYVFRENACRLKENCELIIEQPQRFNELSRNIAADFSEKHSAHMSAGVFVVAVVTYSLSDHERKKLILLVKMDKTASFSYSRVEVSGRWVAVLDEVPNALSENKKSVQKSAVIDPEGYFAWNVLAFDRVKVPRLGDYYREFLGVQERQQDAELTRIAHRAVKIWARRLAPENMPEGEDAHSFTGRAVNYLRDHTCFITDDFINTVVRDDNVQRKTELQASLREALAADGVSGQQFVPNIEALVRGELKQKYETAEGVAITFEGDKDAAGLSVEDLPDGCKRIIIITRQLTLK